METIIIGVAMSIWRFWDGSDDRKSGSNLIAIFLAFTAGGVALVGGVLDPLRIGIVVCATLTVAYLLVRGMPGWESLPKMLAAFAVPTLALGGAYGVLTTHTAGTILFALSGVVVAVTYSQLSRIEASGRTVPLMPAEKWGRLSYGSLASLCLI